MLFSTTPASTTEADSPLMKPAPPPLPTEISFKQYITSPVNSSNEEILKLLQLANLTPEEALAFTFAPTPYQKPTEEEIHLCEDACLRLGQSLANDSLVSTECMDRLQNTPVYSTMEKLWYSMAVAVEMAVVNLQDLPHGTATSRLLALITANTRRCLAAPIPPELLTDTGMDAGLSHTAHTWRSFVIGFFGKAIFPEIQYLETDTSDRPVVFQEAMVSLKFVLGWRLNACTTLSHALRTETRSILTADLINILAATAPDKDFIDRYTVYELATAVVIANFYAALEKSRAVDKSHWARMAEITTEDYLCSVSKTLRMLPTEFSLVSMPGNKQFVRIRAANVNPGYVSLLFLTAYHAKAEATRDLIASIMPEEHESQEAEATCEFLTPENLPRINNTEYITRDIEAYSLDTPPMENFPTTLYTLKLKHLSSPRLPFLMQCTEAGALRLIFPTAKATINNLLHTYNAPPNKTVAQLPLLVDAFLALADDTAGELLTTTLDNKFQWVEMKQDSPARVKSFHPLMVLNSEVESIYKLMGITIEDEQKMYHPLNLFRVVEMGATPGNDIPNFRS